MQNLPSLGTAISEVVGPTFALYEKLLQQRAGVIQAQTRQTFAYGEHERQTLDVYFPTNNQWPGRRRPVLVWIYGGGFTVGSKTLAGYADGAVYANVGHFFASKMGFTVVIPDYRLVEHGGRFPSGAEDLALALDWIRRDLTQRPSYASVDVFLMGNSAGGVHLATFLLAEQFAEQRRTLIESCAGQGDVRLRGVLFVSVPFHFEEAPPERKPGLEAYYGGTDLKTNSPLGLLRASGRPKVVESAGVSCSVWTGTLDSPEEIVKPTSDFQAEWARYGGPPLEAFWLEGHNHMSPQLSLGTGVPEEEAWGFAVGRFCMASTST